MKIYIVRWRVVATRVLRLVVLARTRKRRLIIYPPLISCPSSLRSSTAIECRPIRFGLDTLSFSILSPSPFPRSREIDDKERRETWNRF